MARQLIDCIEMGRSSHWTMQCDMGLTFDLAPIGIGVTGAKDCADTSMMHHISVQQA